MESKRIITLNDKEDFFYKSKEENLNIISYQVHLEDEIFVFDVDGVLQEDAVSVSESRAILSL